LRADREGRLYEHETPKFELIIEDCDKAISLNKDYVKAINRRANALEALDRLEEALRGRLRAPVTHLI
jgi:tetratricopeptide (TPR) repeat protein